MIKKVKFAISALTLVLFASCGKSGSNNSGNNQAYANQQYAQCGNDPNCYNQQFSQQYGPQQGGYYGGTQGCGGGYQCQVYNVPNYQNGCNQGCGTQQYVVAPQGAYMPNQNIYGQGGSFFVGGSW